MPKSLRARLVNLMIRRRLRAKPLMTMEAGKLRTMIEKNSIMPLRKGCKVEPISTAGFSGEWHVPASGGPASEARSHNQADNHSNSQNVILYLHGGGYVFGSARTHRGLTIPLARLTGTPVFSLNYSLAPDHVFPAALVDAVAAYQWLMQVKGYRASQISVGGDSAGGGLALALMLKLKALGAELPASLFLYSPFTDLTYSGASISENAHTDHMFTRETILDAAAIYAPDMDLENPFISPLFGDLTGMPATQIFASNTELLRDDSTRLHEKLKHTDAGSDLIITDDLVHVWPLFNQLMPEAYEDVSRTAEFITRNFQP